MMEEDQDFNTERFIDEVKERPAIWDIISEDYKNRERKKQQWIELCLMFCQKYEESTPKLKSEMCVCLQRKLKNIKDCYRKHWKNIKSTKSGQSRTEKRQYVYAHMLYFLDNTFELGPTEASPNISLSNAPNIEDNSDADEVYSEDKTQARSKIKSLGSSASTIYRRKKRGLEEKIEIYIECFQANQHNKPVEEEGDDMYFLKSLLPVVEIWPLQEKLKFRMEVMNLAMSYAERNKDQTTTHAAFPEIPASTQTLQQTTDFPPTLKIKRPRTLKKYSLSQPSTAQQDRASCIFQPQPPATQGPAPRTQQSKIFSRSTQASNGNLIFRPISDVLSAARLDLYGHPRNSYTSGSVSPDCYSEPSEDPLQTEDFV